nr:Cox2 [Porphyridium purpureum]
MFVMSNYAKSLYCDMPESWQLDFQDGASPVMLGIILRYSCKVFLNLITLSVSGLLLRLHHDLMLILSSILGFVSHGSTIEIIWTIIPCLILIVISIPSFSLLYSLDEVVEPAVTIKITGLQWFWNYEYSDYISEEDEVINYDSYLILDEELTLGQLKMLDVDNRLVPIYTHIRLLVTASDVLHSFAVPSLGIKCDAIPGRLNQTSLFSLREGVYYGGCSEICGVNHAAMPIVIECVSLNNYVSWVFAKFKY